jgi:hypothetical protein
MEFEGSKQKTAKPSAKVLNQHESDWPTPPKSSRQHHRNVQRRLKIVFGYAVCAKTETETIGEKKNKFSCIHFAKMPKLSAVFYKKKNIFCNHLHYNYLFYDKKQIKIL